MGKKFKLAIWTAACLWMVVLIQIVSTRIYVSKTDFAQAFARNRLTVEKENKDTRNLQEGNTCLEGHVPGKLEAKEMEKLADGLFQTMGGGCVMEHSDADNDTYYVAYGYTSGIKSFKKVNGHRVNLNVEIRYDETKDRTRVTMGTPIINNDF